MSVASIAVRMQIALARRAHEEAGQTLAEYALLLTFVALVALVAVALLASNVSNVFASAAKALP
jgi:Flp pilus assembly pilin Flp